jgi:endonuclease-3 related protein
MNINQEFFIKIFNTLFDRYGDLKWWPAESPFEVAIGAILTQNTTWANVQKSIKNLKNRITLLPEMILSLSVDELKELIRPSGFYNQKAERLIIFSRFVSDVLNGDIRNIDNINTTSARGMLLKVKGIGEETADSILLYASNHPIFVVDKYTMRMFNRIGVGWEEKYNIFQKNIMEYTPKDLYLYRHYHALIVENSKNHCKARPICINCPIEKICMKIYTK